MGSSESDSDSGDAADEDSLSDAESSESDDAEAEAAGLMDVESDKEEDDAAAAAAVTTATTTTTTSEVTPCQGGGDPEKRDKGKQRAEDPPNITGNSVPVSHPRTRRPRGRRPPVSVLRPILTIQRSQGFVWNQVCFLPPAPPPLPPSFLSVLRTHNRKILSGSLRSTVHQGPLYVYIVFGRMCEVHLPCCALDVASTSPPTSTGAFSACGSTSTSLGDYEIEVVEIRVRDGELDDIIP